jgi:glutaconate CoA-transferase subunit B
MIGSDYRRPKSMMLGVRGFPGNSINHANSFFVPNHSPRCSWTARSTWWLSVGYNPARLARGWSLDEIDIRLIVTNLCVMDFGGPRTSCGCACCTRASSAEQVQEATGFDLHRPAARRASHRPSADEARAAGAPRPAQPARQRC